MPTGRKEPKKPWTRVRSVIYSSGFSGRAVETARRVTSPMAGRNGLALFIMPSNFSVASTAWNCEYALFLTSSYSAFTMAAIVGPQSGRDRRRDGGVT